jgi:hypothetical protein
MSDGTRVEGARNKGKQAAERQLKTGKLQSNPYSNARPTMKEAWQQAFDAELKGEPPPAKPDKPAKKKPGRKPKPSKAELDHGDHPDRDADPITIDEPVMPADDEIPQD